MNWGCCCGTALCDAYSSTYRILLLFASLSFFVPPFLDIGLAAVWIVQRQEVLDISAFKFIIFLSDKHVPLEFQESLAKLDEVSS